VSLSIAVILFALSLTVMRVASRYRWPKRALGTVRVDRASFGSFSFTVEDCRRVGEARPDSYGADLLGSGGHDMRILRAGNDLQLWLYPKRGGPGFPIDRSGCSQWDVMFDWEDVQTMNLVGGSVSIRCAVGGGQIDGTVGFDHCRP
jgi:hypothetical protein